MQKTAPRPPSARISFLSASVLGLGAAVASRGAVFLANIMLAHSLTVHDFGLFSYAYVTALNLGLFLATGVSQAAGHVLPLTEDPERRRRQLCAFIVLLVALIAVAATALYLSATSISIAAFGSAQGGEALRMAAIVLIATAFTQALQAFLYAMHEHRASASVSIGAALLLLAMLWTMGPIRQPVVALVIFLAINAGAAASQLVILGRTTQNQRGPWRTGRQELRLAFKHALPSVLTTSMGAPVHWICLSMLAAMTDGAHQLALFSVAFQWYIAITFIPATLGNLALPFLARNTGATEAMVRQRFGRRCCSAAGCRWRWGAWRSCWPGRSLRGSIPPRTAALRPACARWRWRPRCAGSACCCSSGSRRQASSGAISQWRPCTRSSTLPRPTWRCVSGTAPRRSAWPCRPPIVA